MDSTKTDTPQTVETENPAGSPILEIDDGRESDEFDRFEDVARKLVQVPKTELDEQRKKS